MYIQCVYTCVCLYVYVLYTHFYIHIICSYVYTIRTCVHMYVCIRIILLFLFININVLYVHTYVCARIHETSLIRHSMGPENNVGLGGCWIMECLVPYLSMVTVPHIMVRLERMLDYKGVGLARFHCKGHFCLLKYSTSLMHMLHVAG